jgi:hypothetical protein
LRRQIEYGAQLGEIDLDIAKRELKLFEKKVLPVCQYLSSKKLLKVVSKVFFAVSKESLYTKKIIK